jgi:hypothetical protein
MAAVLKPITLTQTLKLDFPLMEQALHVGCGLWAVFQLSRFLCSVLALPLVTRQSASLGMAVEPGTGQSHTKI